MLFGGIPLYGQERANLRIFTALGAVGVESLFLTNGEHGHMVVEPELKRLGLPWMPAPYGPNVGASLSFRGWWRVLGGIIGTNFALLRAIREFRPTHLHVMNPLYALYASPALLLCSVPLIYRIGDAPPVSSPWFRRFWSLLTRRMAVLVCNAGYVERRCLAAGFPAAKLRLIYSAARPPVPRATASVTVSVSHFWEDERGHVHTEAVVHPDPNSLTAVYCGQLNQNKGFHLAIEAVDALIREGRSIRLLIAGDYSYRTPLAAELKARVEREGLQDRIRFLGYVNDVPKLLSVADVQLCPSLWQEPLANTVLEAKSAGLPSVIFPNGGLPEAVRHGVDGWVCQEQTAAGMTEALRFYLDHPEELRRHGAAAAQSASGSNRFGLGSFRDAWLDVYRSTARLAR